jgi:hypothetical protein
VLLSDPTFVRGYGGLFGFNNNNNGNGNTNVSSRVAVVCGARTLALKGETKRLPFRRAKFTDFAG